MSRPINRVLLCLPLVVIPLVYSPASLDPALAARNIAFCVFLLLLFGFLMIRSKAHAFTHAGEGLKRWFFLFLVYGLFSSLSLLIRPLNPSDGWSQWLQIFCFGASVLGFGLLLPSISGYKILLAKTLLLLAVINVLIGYYQLVTKVLPAGYTHANTYLLTGSYANKNIFAEILCVLLPVQVYALFKLSGKWKALAAFGLFSSLFLLLITLSRSAWVSLAFSLLLMGALSVYYFPSYKASLPRISKPALLSLLGAILLGGIASWFLLRVPDRLMQKQLHSLFHPRYGSAKDRLVLWEKTLEIIQEKPLLGSGPGTWKIHIMRYGNQGLTSENNVTFYQRPHNDYLWIWCEQGGIALLFFFAFMLLALLPLISFDRNKPPGAWQLVLLFSIMIYLCVSFFAFPRERIEHLLLFSLFIAAALQETSFKKAWFGGQLVNPRVPGLAILLVVVLSLIVGIQRYTSERWLRQAMEARAKQQWQASLRFLAKAENKYYRFDPTSTPLSWYKGIALYNLEPTPKSRRACLD